MRVFSAIGFLALSAITLLSQQQANSPHGEHTTQAGGRLQVIADGALNPEKIPEDLVLRHLFIHLSNNGTNFDMKASRIGLNSTDSTVLRQVVSSFRDGFQQHQVRLRALRSSRNTDSANTQAIQTAVDLDSQFMTLVASTYSEITVKLSEGGRKKLSEYINEMKASIRIMAPPRM